MRRSVKKWLDGFRDLGSAYFGVMKAEASALERDLGTSGRQLLVALAIITVALGIGFWALAALVLAAIEILALWLPRWGASLVVAFALLLITVLIGALGWRRLRRVETPKATLNRHIEDHREWWREQIGTSDEERRVNASRLNGEGEER